MLTAAHCQPSSGNVSYPHFFSVGQVLGNAEENWHATNGTQYYTGQNVYRGDVALIRYTNKFTDGYIYSGAAGGSGTKAVEQMATHEAQNGNNVCVNGSKTGLWCGDVTATGINQLYFGDGPNLWARNVVEGFAVGEACPAKGDSGAPVYRVLAATGNVAAVGIFSGFADLVEGCFVYFTDIYDAVDGLPGSLQTTP
jgi:hypothetical protein